MTDRQTDERTDGVGKTVYRSLYAMHSEAQTLLLCWQMYKTAVYTQVNGDLQKVTHLKQHKSWTVILLEQHLARVNMLLTWYRCSWFLLFTLRAKLSCAVYCYRSCMWLWCLQRAGGQCLNLTTASALAVFASVWALFMRPSSLGGGRIMRRTLTVCPSVPLSLPSVTSFRPR